MEIRTAKKFSLVELITVVAIAGIILTITVPAFLTMTKGQAVNIAMREIGSKLKAVRTYAITHRTRCALVFITNQTMRNPEQNYGFKAYRACEVNNDNSFKQWVEDEKWEFFPMGAALFAIVSSSGKTFVNGDYDTNAGLALAQAKDINFPEDVVNNLDKIIVIPGDRNLKGIVFKPTGDLDGGNTCVYIGEGQRITDNTIKIFNDKNISTITINQFTGRVSYE